MLKYRSHFSSDDSAMGYYNTTKIHFVLPFIFEFNHPSEV